MLAKKNYDQFQSMQILIKANDNKYLEVEESVQHMLQFLVPDFQFVVREETCRFLVQIENYTATVQPWKCTPVKIKPKSQAKLLKNKIYTHHLSDDVGLEGRFQMRDLLLFPNL